MKTICKVLDVSTPQNISKKDGTLAVKHTLILSEMGGKFEDMYAVAWIGPDTINLKIGDTIAAVLRFSVNSFEGKDFQDILLVDYLPLAVPMGLPRVPIV